MTTPYRTALLVVALFLAALAAPARVAVVVTSAARERLPEQVMTETQAEVASAIATLVGAEIEKLGGVPVAGQEGAPTLKDGEPAYAAYAKAANAEIMVRIEVRRWTQRNRAPGDVLRNPNEPGSRSEVELDLAIWKNGVMSRFEKRKTTVGGPFFGTQRRDEMSGSPDDISRMIRAVNRRRAQTLARAAWEAARDPIARALTP